MDRVQRGLDREVVVDRADPPEEMDVEGGREGPLGVVVRSVALSPYVVLSLQKPAQLHHRRAVEVQLLLHLMAGHPPVSLVGDDSKPQGLHEV